MKAILVAIATLSLTVASAPLLTTAFAQSTGGSFGGGSFGGGGSSGGGSSGGSYSGGSYSGGSYSGGDYSGGGDFSPANLLCMLVLAVLVLVFVVIGERRKARLRSGGARGWDKVDVSALRLGIDWRARPALQAELERLASSGNTHTRLGLAMLLRYTILALQRAELSWLYCDVSNYHPMSAAMAEGIFRQLGVDSRSRFTREVVRNADGSTSTMEAGPLEARAHEGEGVVVVTLLVASRRELVDVTETQDANRIKTLLSEMLNSAQPESLVALEVIWSPAVDEDRMSTAELEAHYPQLSKIDERSIAGRVFCGYCRGPFAMELPNCPHCGAPAPRA